MSETTGKGETRRVVLASGEVREVAITRDGDGWFASSGDCETFPQPSPERRTRARESTTMNLLTQEDWAQIVSARCRAECTARCPSCNALIDPDCCWCGDTPEGWDHHSMDGHPFVPNGCVCMMHGHRGYCDPREQRCAEGNP